MAGRGNGGSRTRNVVLLVLVAAWAGQQVRVLARPWLCC